MKKTVLIITLIGIAGIMMNCGSSKHIHNQDAVDHFHLNDTFLIELNALLICEDDHDLFVSFDTVYNDSRCPEGDNCIWEGNAELGFKVNYDKQLENVKLNTNADLESTSTFSNYTIKLIEFMPYPGTVNYATDPKTAKLIITKSN